MIPGNLTEEEWNALSPAERDQLSGDLEDVAGGESLREFIVRLSPHHPPPRHLDAIIEEIEACRARPGKVLISLPPGHAKTTLILNAIAWWLTINPGDTNGYFSYNERQGFSKSVLARTLAARAGVELSDEVNAKAEWRTHEGGGLLAGGIGSGLTGQRIQGLLVIDDPFKGPVDSSSQAYRDEVDDWFKMVAMTRRDGASVFVIHTRWHDDDLIGRLKDEEGWTVINMPAIAGDDDWIGDEKREPGSALWSERYPLEFLVDTKREIGEYNFAALYQGAPRPRGGSVFGEPHYYDPTETSFEGCAILLGADPAASEKTSADYSAAVVLSVIGKGVEAKGYVRYVYRKQVTIPVFVTALHSIQQRFGNTAVNVESVGGFKAVPQMLKALGLTRINEIIPVGDKFTRAQPAAAAWNDGRLLVPADNPPWLGDFLDELEKFTGVNDAHDDQVDALSTTWNPAGEPSATYKRPPAGGRQRRV